MKTVIIILGLIAIIFHSISFIYYWKGIKNMDAEVKVKGSKLCSIGSLFFYATMICALIFFLSKGW